MSTPKTINPLVMALVEALVFFELSDEEAVEPDAAVAAMEAIADILRRMTAQEREAFTHQLALIADQQSGTELGIQRSEYIRAIPEYLGLSTEQ